MKYPGRGKMGCNVGHEHRDCFGEVEGNKYKCACFKSK